MDYDRTAVGLALCETARTSRRRLLTRLAALPAVFGLGVFIGSDSSEAKNRHGKKKSHKRKKRGSKQKGNGSGGYSPDGEERAFLDLINNYRNQHGVGALTLQNQLGAAADHHSRDMAKKNYFEHSSSGSVKNFGYTNWRFIGENIYAGSESASSAMNAWKNSAGHNKNMLSGNFTEIGIGRAYNKNSKYGWYWTTSFGSR